MDVDLINTSQVAAMCGIARGTLYDWCYDADSTFPKPMKLGRGLRWHRAVVVAWIEAQRAGVQS